MSLDAMTSQFFFSVISAYFSHWQQYFQSHLRIIFHSRTAQVRDQTVSCLLGALFLQSCNTFNDTLDSGGATETN